MLKGIDIQETIEYSSQLDGGDSKTIFLIGNLPQRDKLRLFSNVTSKDGTFDKSVIEDKAGDIFKSGVKGIRNLRGKDYTVITDEVYELIHLPVLIEVIGKIIEYNFSFEGIEKN